MVGLIYQNKVFASIHLDFNLYEGYELQGCTASGKGCCLTQIQQQIIKTTPTDKQLELLNFGFTEAYDLRCL